jgi:hypothetical protein
MLATIYAVIFNVTLVIMLFMLIFFLIKQSKTLSTLLFLLRKKLHILLY